MPTKTKPVAKKSVTKKAAAKPAPKTSAKAPAARMSLAEVMKALEAAGSEQTRKTYARHGIPQPMFGVSFATFSVLQKRIKVDQELAQQLWDTGNSDARILAMKIADPARMTASQLDRWAPAVTARMVSGYFASLVAEGPHASAKAAQWLRAPDEPEAAGAWSLVGQMAMRDVATPDAWFAERLTEIERGIHDAPNRRRYHMNEALICIGGRSTKLRDAAIAAAKRIGHVEVDHGDTSCKTPEARSYIEKMWARAKSGGYETPAAQERDRDSPRTRC